MVWNSSTTRQELRLVLYMYGFGGGCRATTRSACQCWLDKSTDGARRAVTTGYVMISVSKHAKVFWIHVFVIHFIFGGRCTTQGLVACWAFGTANLETLGFGIPDDNSIAMTPV